MFTTLHESRRYNFKLATIKQRTAHGSVLNFSLSNSAPPHGKKPHDTTPRVPTLYHIIPKETINQLYQNQDRRLECRALDCTADETLHRWCLNQAMFCRRQ